MDWAITAITHILAKHVCCESQTASVFLGLCFLSCFCQSCSVTSSRGTGGRSATSTSSFSTRCDASSATAGRTSQTGCVFLTDHVNLHSAESIYFMALCRMHPSRPPPLIVTFVSPSSSFRRQARGCTSSGGSSDISGKRRKPGNTHLLSIHSLGFIHMFSLFLSHPCWKHWGWVSFCPGEDEPDEAEDRPEAEGGSDHLRHVDHLQWGGHEVSASWPDVFHWALQCWLIVTH